MSARRIFALALLTQGLLVLAAWAASRAWRLVTPWGDPVRDTAIGVMAAVAIAAVNYLLLVHAPSSWIVDGIRKVYAEILVPVFSPLSTGSIIVLGAAAGLGEEWLFRGVVQPVLGLPAASLVFGLAHVGGQRMLPLGVWAAVMGLALGGLAMATGGLIAPIVAHGLYDMLALGYIRRGAHHE